MKPQSTTLDIKGMTCASCVGRIERVLKKNDGVLNASVNLATEKASIDFNPDKTSIESLIALVTKAGYEASLHNEKIASDVKADLKRDEKIIFFSALMSLPLIMPMFFSPFGHHFMLPGIIQLTLASAF